MMRRRNKYGAKKVTIDGKRFDSKLEGERYLFLSMLAQAGEIEDLNVHSKHPLEVDGRPVLLKSTGYPNGRRVSWIDDFNYIHEGERWHEDVKGMDTIGSRLRRAFLEATNPDMHIRVVKKADEDVGASGA